MYENATKNPKHYTIVMAEIAMFFKKISEKYDVKIICMPSSFDFMFLKCYYNFAECDKIYDIGYFSLCISTLWIQYKNMKKLSNKNSAELKEVLMNTDKCLEHHALDDAKMQGLFYLKLLDLMEVCNT
jgi:hypothetical protein